MNNRELVVRLLLAQCRRQGLNYWNCDPSPHLSYSRIEEFGIPEGQHGIEAVLYEMFKSGRIDPGFRGMFSRYVSWAHALIARDDPHDPIHCAAHESCFTRPDHCQIHKYCQTKPKRWYPEP